MRGKLFLLKEIFLGILLIGFISAATVTDSLPYYSSYQNSITADGIEINTSIFNSSFIMYLNNVTLNSYGTGNYCWLQNASGSTFTGGNSSNPADGVLTGVYRVGDSCNFNDYVLTSGTFYWIRVGNVENGNYVESYKNTDLSYPYLGTNINFVTGDVNVIYNIQNVTTTIAANITYPAPLDAIQWENESILNVNSSVWWNNLNAINSTQLEGYWGVLSLSTSWLSSFITSLINYNYVHNLGFYPSSNPSNYYNQTTLPNDGTSFDYYDLLEEDITTNLSNQTTPIFLIPLSAGKSISIDCNLLVNSAATTTGIRLESNSSGTSSTTQVIEYYSSATAQAICSGIGENLTCAVTSSAGTKITPTRINVYTNQSNTGTYALKLRSEISGSAVNVRAGSWCRSIEL
jgi:hypothetical protein